MSVKQLTEAEFEAMFTMVKNHLDNNAGLDGCMFETYGEEMDYIQSLADSKKVWTYIEGDDDLYFVTGLHRVNRLGYFVTTEPYATEYEVKLEILTETE